MSEEKSAQHEAIQNVVNHVAAYQDGAPEGTVSEELARGFKEAGVEVTDEQRDALARAIEDAEGSVDAAEILG
ncbi:MAG: hypothetical protein JWP31_1626 [Aeromicrobium sp.]|nr:hypothetical protein [Aeromicrobium sp.]